MSPLLVLDFDGTLCPSLPVPGLVAWRQAVDLAGEDLLPVEGAVEGVARLLKVCDEAVILTARPVQLAAVTAEWIWRHVPDLRGVPLSMREPAESDQVRGSVSKARRLETFRDVVSPGDRPVFLVDDDANMARALRPTDVFWLAPQAWRALPLVEIMSPPASKGSL